jgi:hypothetical protein
MAVLAKFGVGGVDTFTLRANDARQIVDGAAILTRYLAFNGKLQTGAAAVEAGCLSKKGRHGFYFNGTRPKIKTMPFSGVTAWAPRFDRESRSF